MRLRFRVFGTLASTIFAGLVVAGAAGALTTMSACGSFGSAPAPASTDADTSAPSTGDASVEDARADASVDATSGEDSAVLPDGAIKCSTALAVEDDKFAADMPLFDTVAAIGGQAGDTLYLAGRAPCGPGATDRSALYSVSLSGMKAMLVCFGVAGERVTSIDADSTGIVIGTDVPATGGSTTGLVRRLNLNASERAPDLTIAFSDGSVSVTTVRRINGVDVWGYTSTQGGNPRGYLATANGTNVFDLGARAVPALSTSASLVATADVAATAAGTTVNVKRYSPTGGTLAPDTSFGTGGVQTLTVQPIGASGLANSSLALRGSMIAVGLAPSSGASVHLLGNGVPPRAISIVGASGRTSVVFDCDGTVLAAYGSTTGNLVRIDPRAATNPVANFGLSSEHASVALLRSTGGETFWVRSYEKGTEVVRLKRTIL